VWRYWIWAIAGPVIATVAVDAFADVYKFVDSAGHVFYTDNPRHAGYRRIIKSTVTVPPKQPRNGSLYGQGLAPFRMGQTLHSQDLVNHRVQYAPLIDAAANKYRLDPALLHAVIRAESSYNPGAVSNKGAVGLMQLMPGTAARYGVRNRQNPAENIEGGARYLSDLIDMFPYDLSLAIAAYNAGENSVKRHGNKVPPIQETREYVSRVLDYYRRMN
jgi:soluble lytic murein transglycosylase-like protein